MYHGTKEKFHLISEAVSTVSAAIDLKNAAEAAEKIDPNDQHQKARMEKEMTLKGLLAMWRMNKLDIEATIRGVCELVLHDPSVDMIIRTKRAEGMRMLGRIFLKVKGSATTLENLM